MGKYIYVTKSLYQCYGVKVIVDQVLRTVPDIKLSHKLDEIVQGSEVMPYGILEAVAVLKRKDVIKGMAVLVDAYSLGEISNFQKYYNKHYISLSYRIKCFLRFLKFSYLEYVILRSYKKVMLVSYNDQRYYNQTFPFSRFKNKLVVIQNGVGLPDVSHREQHKLKPEVLRIGCLSQWSGPSYYTLQFFLNEVWMKLPSRDGLELIIAGKGLDEYRQNYISKFPNVKIVGFVEKLNDFYDNIDVSLITMVKKCGIINRVLDGFSFEVPVLCRPESTLAFKNLPDCCYLYNDAHSFMESIDKIRYNYEDARNKAAIARNFVACNHDWDRNYLILKKYNL